MNLRSRQIPWHLLLALAMAGLLWRLAGIRAWSVQADVYEFLAHMALLFALYGAACGLVLRRASSQSRQSLLILFGAACVFRLLLLPAGLPGGWNEAGHLAEDLRGELTFDSFLLYDNDIWRYLWDGRVTSSGINIYRWSPEEIEASEDPLLEALLAPDSWEEVHSRVGYASYRTVYPPLAQGLFALAAWVAPASVVLWKLLMVLFDLGSCFLLMSILKELGRPPQWAPQQKVPTNSSERPGRSGRLGMKCSRVSRRGRRSRLREISESRERIEASSDALLDVKAANYRT